jgi:hypothetical protein
MQIDSPFPLTEHLKALHYNHTHPPDSHIVQPITAEIAKQLSHPPPNTGREIWLYELGRFLIQKTNAIIVALFADSPPCSAQTCPEMRASEWQYLCAVHDPPKSCAAIDYCCHTLDWAATMLCSSKMFPSRLALGSGAQAGFQGDRTLQAQMKEITNIFRRVYRIYAHAWFQHRDMFWRVEAKTGLYVFFKTVCDEYGIIQPENYTIPPEAEGLEPEVKEESTTTSPQEPILLQRDGSAPEEEPAGNHVLAAGDTTKRHRTTPSDRSTSVTSVATVIQEEAEEEEENQAQVDTASLEQQATSLKDFAESLPQPGQQQQEAEEPVKEEEAEAKEEKPSEDEEPPAPGLNRSDTLKAPKEEEEEEKAAGEPEGDGDLTVVTVVEGQPEEEPKKEEGAEDVKEEAPEQPE